MLGNNAPALMQMLVRFSGEQLIHLDIYEMSSVSQKAI